MHFWAERVKQAGLINRGFNLVWPVKRDVGISVYGRCPFCIGLSVLHKKSGFSVFMSNTTCCFPDFSIRFSANFKAIIRICVQSRKFPKKYFYSVCTFDRFFFLKVLGGRLSSTNV